MLAIHYLFSFLYFGAFWPHTAMVKIHQGQSGLWGPWPPFARVGYQIDWFFEDQGYRLLALVVLALLGAIASRRTILFRIGFPFLILYTSFYVALSLPNYHWYYAPYYLFGFFWAGVGAGWLWLRAKATRSRAVRGALAAALISLMVLLVAGGFSSTWRSLEGPRSMSAYRQIGEWLESNTPVEATVAAMEIGTLGWYSRRYIVDIVGLVTPENDRLLAARDFDGWLDLHQPDYVVTHLPEWRMERVVKAAVRNGEYRPVETIELPGYRVLERNPLATLGRIDELLMNLRGGGDPEQREVLIDIILSRGMGPVVQLGGDDVVVANLSPDRWTRATEPAGIVVRNDGVDQKAVELHLSCLAPAAALPVTVFLAGEEGMQTIVFSEAGTQVVELWPVSPGRTRLFTVWTDKAWQPKSKDRRWLGVNLARP